MNYINIKYVSVPGVQQNKITVTIFLAVEIMLLYLLLERPSPSTGKRLGC